MKTLCQHPATPGAVVPRLACVYRARILLLLFSFSAFQLFSFSAHAAYVRFAFTNALGNPDTNSFRVVPIGSVIQSDGSFITRGPATRLTPAADGKVTNSFNQGHYQVTNQWLARGFLIRVPLDTGPTIYDATSPTNLGGLALSGYNTFVTITYGTNDVTFNAVTNALGGPPIQEIIAGTNIVVIDNGDRTRTIHGTATGSGSATNAIENLNGLGTNTTLTGSTVIGTGNNITNILGRAAGTNLGPFYFGGGAINGALNIFDTSGSYGQITYNGTEISFDKPLNGNGSTLSSLNASSLASGTVAAARIPNVLTNSETRDVLFVGAFRPSPTGSGSEAVAVGGEAQATGADSVAIGFQTYATAWDSLALGAGAVASHSNSVALGATAQTTTNSQIRIGTSTHTTSIPGALQVTGTNVSGYFTGDAGGLTNHQWGAISNMPGGFADGVDDAGGGDATNVFLGTTNAFIVVWTNAASDWTLNAAFAPQPASENLTNWSSLDTNVLTGLGSQTNIYGSFSNSFQIASINNSNVFQVKTTNDTLAIQVNTNATVTFAGPIKSASGSNWFNGDIGVVGASYLAGGLTADNDIILTSGTFVGDGSTITNLSASNIASGSLADARLSTNVSLLGSSINDTEIANGAVQLGQHTTGGYVGGLSSTAPGLLVTGSGGEGSTPVLSWSNRVDVAGTIYASNFVSYADAGGVAGFVEFAEGTAPGTPASGYLRAYTKTDGKLYIKDDADVETDLTLTGASSTNIAYATITNLNSGTQFATNFATTNISKLLAGNASGFVESATSTNGTANQKLTTDGTSYWWSDDANDGGGSTNIINLGNFTQITSPQGYITFQAGADSAAINVGVDSQFAFFSDKSDGVTWLANPWQTNASITLSNNGGISIVGTLSSLSVTTGNFENANITNATFTGDLDVGGDVTVTGGIYPLGITNLYTYVDSNGMLTGTNNGSAWTNLQSDNISYTTNIWAGSAAIIDFSRGKSVSTNMSGDLTITGIAGFVDAEDNWQIVDLNPSGADRLLTVPADWFVSTNTAYNGFTNATTAFIRSGTWAELCVSAIIGRRTNAVLNTYY